MINGLKTRVLFVVVVVVVCLGASEANNSSQSMPDMGSCACVLTSTASVDAAKAPANDQMAGRTRRLYRRANRRMV